MQLVQQTSTVLKLQAQKNFSRFFLLLFGTPFFLAGLAVMIFLGQLTTLLMLLLAIRSRCR